MMSASSIARSASAEESSAASAAPSLSVPSEGAADVAPPVAAAAPPVPVRAWYGLGLADSKLLVPPPEVPPLLEPASPSEPFVVLPAWPSEPSAALPVPSVSWFVGTGCLRKCCKHGSTP